jgi:hypothetical protein
VAKFLPFPPSIGPSIHARFSEASLKLGLEGGEGPPGGLR